LADAGGNDGGNKSVSARLAEKGERLRELLQEFVGESLDAPPL
jgi:hypothetical protein